MADKNVATTSALEAPAMQYHDRTDGAQYAGGNSEAFDRAPLQYELGSGVESSEGLAQAIQEIEAKKKHWYSYLATKEFWIVITIGQILSLCITATNTFSTFLATDGTSLPAFQNLLNYILLSLIYVPLVLYKYGFKKYFSLFFSRSKEHGRFGLGWKYFILSFMDVEGNYFTVLAYRYTNLLSAQLLNFWSIVMVVLVSFFFLKVRYGWWRIIGIVICCGGMGLLLGSDSITSGSGGDAPDKLKGDLFGLLGATFYGLSNVFEEWFVSKRPMYETLSFLGLFGVIILGVQTAIFDRDSFATATWDSNVAGWLVGYAIVLTFFYTLAPLMFRLGSAAFFDISLLTANFWGAIIGINVFGYSIYYLYPIAFVMIILGLLIYFVSGSILGDSKKPWLGENQELGVAGVGTAKLKAIRLAEREQAQSASGV